MPKTFHHSGVIIFMESNLSTDGPTINFPGQLVHSDSVEQGVSDYLRLLDDLINGASWCMMNSSKKCMR